MNIKEMYQNNPDFRRYVDKHASGSTEGKQITVEEALSYAVVREYVLWLVEQERG